MFSYSGQAYKTTHSVIGIYLNEVRNLYIYDREPSSGNLMSNIGYVWTFVLQVNDKVHLQIDSAQLYVDDDQRFFFNGWLLNTIWKNTFSFTYPFRFTFTSMIKYDDYLSVLQFLCLVIFSGK